MLLSIITPTLNATRYLPDCIESVQAQLATGGAVEHVIVDGGSTDGTVEYAEAQKLRVLRGTDRGIFDAINRGSRESCGSWVGFLGADDVMLPGGLQALIDAARITSAPWMTGGVRYVDAEFRSIGRLQPLPHWTPLSLHACLGWSAIHHIATYISRDFFDALGGFDIEYTVAADYELFCRASMQARPCRIAKPVAAMRRTGHNFSARHAELGRQQCAAIRQRYGPRSLVTQNVYRQVIRIWVNAANPTWSLRKVLGTPY